MRLSPLEHHLPLRLRHVRRAWLDGVMFFEISTWCRDVSLASYMYWIHVQIAYPHQVCLGLLDHSLPLRSKTTAKSTPVPFSSDTISANPSISHQSQFQPPYTRPKAPLLHSHLRIHTSYYPNQPWPTPTPQPHHPNNPATKPNISTSISITKLNSQTKSNQAIPNHPKPSQTIPNHPKPSQTIPQPIWVSTP